MGRRHVSPRRLGAGREELRKWIAEKKKVRNLRAAWPLRKGSGRPAHAPRLAVGCAGGGRSLRQPAPPRTPRIDAARPSPTPRRRPVRPVPVVPVRGARERTKLRAISMGKCFNVVF